MFSRFVSRRFLTATTPSSATVATPSSSSLTSSSFFSFSSSPLQFSLTRFASSSSQQQQQQQQQQRPAVEKQRAVAQISDEAELAEIMKKVQIQNQQQQQQNPQHQQSGSKLLCHVHPEIFSELSVDKKKVKLCEKYLPIDSPELFRWDCGTCKKSFVKSVVERCLFDSACPHCQAESKPELLSDSRPDLMGEISDLLNNPFLDVPNLTVDSKTKVWWKCRGCGCEFQAKVNERAKFNKAGCPRCNIQKSEFIAEKLRKEWHPIKNGDLDPAKVLLLSEKKKVVWWLCSTCTHEWLAKVQSRFSGQGCPECLGKTRSSSSSSLNTFSSSSSSSSSPMSKNEKDTLRKKMVRMREAADEKSRLLAHQKNLEQHELLLKKRSALTSSRSKSGGTKVVTKSAAVTSKRK